MYLNLPHSWLFLLFYAHVLFKFILVLYNGQKLFIRLWYRVDNIKLHCLTNLLLIFSVFIFHNFFRYYLNHCCIFYFFNTITITRPIFFSSVYGILRYMTPFYYLATLTFCFWWFLHQLDLLLVYFLYILKINFFHLKLYYQTCTNHFFFYFHKLFFKCIYPFWAKFSLFIYYLF